MDSQKQFVRVQMRWMIRRDMVEVLRIEQLSRDYPWGEEDFLRHMRQRNSIGMVAEMGEQVVGFIVYEFHKRKLYILNFAVHPDYLRLGIGTQMAKKLISRLSDDRWTRIVLEIRETNLDGQLFFREVGFRGTGVLREFYADSGEDAFVFEYRLAQWPTKPAGAAR